MSAALEAGGASERNPGEAPVESGRAARPRNRLPVGKTAQNDSYSYHCILAIPTRNVNRKAAFPQCKIVYFLCIFLYETPKKRTNFRKMPRQPDPPGRDGKTWRAGTGKPAAGKPVSGGARRGCTAKGGPHSGPPQDVRMPGRSKFRCSAGRHAGCCRTG